MLDELPSPHRFDACVPGCSLELSRSDLSSSPGRPRTSPVTLPGSPWNNLGGWAARAATLHASSLRLLLFCTCLPLCVGAPWPMPAWVWLEVRSVFFNLTNRNIIYENACLSQAALSRHQFHPLHALPPTRAHQRLPIPMTDTLGLGKTTARHDTAVRCWGMGIAIITAGTERCERASAGHPAAPDGRQMFGGASQVAIS